VSDEKSHPQKQIPVTRTNVGLISSRFGQPTRLELRQRLCDQQTVTSVADLMTKYVANVSNSEYSGTD
jgi:hypothetical protein